ncbi:MAG: hypothetical protein AAF193_07145, partial [Bacteroidota bacterium]
MKKTVLYLSLVVFTTVLIVSCTKDDPEEVAPDTTFGATLAVYGPRITTAFSLGAQSSETLQQRAESFFADPSESNFTSFR